MNVAISSSSVSRDLDNTIERSRSKFSSLVFEMLNELFIQHIVKISVAYSYYIPVADESRPKVDKSSRFTEI
jgi:hypothetical protein